MSNPEAISQDIAREAARQISNHWRSGKFRQDGGVVEGITHIIQEAIDAGFEECRSLWGRDLKQHQTEFDRLAKIIETDTLRVVELEEHLKDAQDEAFGAYAEADALREQLAAVEKQDALESGGIQTMWRESRTIVELRKKLEQTEKVRDEWATEFRKLRDELHPPLPNK